MEGESRPTPGYINQKRVENMKQNEIRVSTASILVEWHAWGLRKTMNDFAELVEMYWRDVKEYIESLPDGDGEARLAATDAIRNVLDAVAVLDPMPSDNARIKAVLSEAARLVSK